MKPTQQPQALQVVVVLLLLLKVCFFLHNLPEWLLKKLPRESRHGPVNFWPHLKHHYGCLSSGLKIFWISAESFFFSKSWLNLEGWGTKKNWNSKGNLRDLLACWLVALEISTQTEMSGICLPLGHFFHDNSVTFLHRIVTKMLLQMARAC